MKQTPLTPGITFVLPPLFAHLDKTALLVEARALGILPISYYPNKEDFLNMELNVLTGSSSIFADNF